MNIGTEVQFRLPKDEHIENGLEWVDENAMSELVLLEVFSYRQLSNSLICPLIRYITRDSIKTSKKAIHAVESFLLSGAVVEISVPIKQNFSNTISSLRADGSNQCDRWESW